MLQPPVWVPFAWWALVVGSVIASMAGDPGVVCTVASPCQPDAIFPMAVALVGVAAVAFWWAPVVALSAGLGYAVLSILFDPSVAGLVVACAAVGGLAVLRTVRTRQAELADAVARINPTMPATPACTGRQSNRARPRGWEAAAIPLVGAAGLVLVAGSLLGYRSQTAGEQEHVDRAQQVNGRVVTGADDDYKQLFQLEAGARAGQRVSIEVTEELPQGSSWVVLLDPQDRAWARLVSEPKGYTYWFGWTVMGGFVATWALLALVAQRRGPAQAHQPATHLVRVTRDSRAELTLPGSTQPVASVMLGTGDTRPRHHRKPVPASVRGPVADGSWVSIDTDAGPLPVVGPVRATHRWRDLDLDFDAHPRVGAIAERTPGIGSVLRQVFFFVLGCFFLWFAVGEVGATWDAAHGRGVAGTFTVTSEDCSGKGPCSHYGDFRSTDGQQSFTDVELVGDSADVGKSVPALYEGRGEAPDSVYAPGWASLAENTVFLALGLGFLLEPVGRLVGAFVLRQHPPTGRHSRERR